MGAELHVIRERHTEFEIEGEPGARVQERLTLFAINSNCHEMSASGQKQSFASSALMQRSY